MTAMTNENATNSSTTKRGKLRKQAQRLFGRSREYEEFEIDPNDRATLSQVLRYGDTNYQELEFEKADFMDPYIAYICTRLTQDLGNKSLEPRQRVNFFVEVVKYFTQYPKKRVASFIEDSKGFLEGMFPANEADSSAWKQYRVTNTILCLSLWITRESLSTSFGDFEVKSRYLQKAKSEKTQRTSQGPENLTDLNLGQFTIPEFAEVAGLLPNISQWVRPEQSDPDEWIRKSELNAKFVRRIGQVKIQWTFDLSKHFLFTDRTLYLFSMPSRLVIQYQWDQQSPEQALVMMGFSREYSDEVIRSYALFFGYEGRPIFEDQYANEIPFPKDPYLASVCITSTGGQYSDKDQIWAKRDFQYLWPRIKNLDTYLRMTPADSFFKILWRDRRNSYGWYTLVFAVTATILALVSTIFTAIGAVKTFYPTHPPSHAPAQGNGGESASISTKETTVTVTTYSSSASGLSSLLTASASASSPTTEPRTSSGFSTGAKAGIGVGAGVGSISFLVLLYTLARCRRWKVSALSALFTGSRGNRSPPKIPALEIGNYKGPVRTPRISIPSIQRPSSNLEDHYSRSRAGTLSVENSRSPSIENHYTQNRSLHSTQIESQASGALGPPRSTDTTMEIGTKAQESHELW